MVGLSNIRNIHRSFETLQQSESFSYAGSDMVVAARHCGGHHPAASAVLGYRRNGPLRAVSFRGPRAGNRGPTSAIDSDSRGHGRRRRRSARNRPHWQARPRRRRPTGPGEITKPRAGPWAGTRSHWHAGICRNAIDGRGSTAAAARPGLASAGVVL